MSMPPPPPPGDSFPQPPPGWQSGGSTPPQPPDYPSYPGRAPEPVKRGNSGIAIASLVCSLVGVIPCFYLFQIMGLLGTIFGFVGLKQTKNGARGGRGMAIAGLVIGIILVLACIAFWIYFATHANCVRSGGKWECTTD